MSKLLVCGDIHTKYDLLEKVIEQGKGYDKVVFLGDYVDEWFAPPQASENILRRIIDYKKADPDKVILILGNHDFSEWQGKPFACSAFNAVTHDIVERIMRQDDNWKLFQVAHAEDGVLYSHAGVTESWRAEYLPSCHSVEEIANRLEWAYLNRPDEQAEKIFYGLAQAGPARGGSGIPSPIWADDTELMADFIKGLSQVVGHTPQITLKLVDNFGRDLAFCDTHSLYSNGLPVGNNFLLEVVDGAKEPIPLAD